jgi:hypothetical protein
MNSQELRALQEAYSQVYTEGFPAVKPSVRSGDVGTSGLKMIQTSGGGTGYINKHSGGNVLPSGTVNSIMKGDLMVKNKNQNQTTQVAHFDIFDVIKGHLLDEGYANSEESAIAIMTNMSEEWKKHIIEMSDFEAGGGNAKMKKSGMSKDQVITLGQKNMAAKPSSSTNSSSDSSNSGGGIKPGDYNINVNFGPKKEPKQQPAAYTPPRSLTRKPYGPATAKSIFQKPDYDVPSFADMKDDQMRSQAQDADEWLVKAGKQKPGYKGTQNIANKTIAKQRAYYGQK